MTEFLFSYGTLQLAEVQRQSFGRLLEGSKDSLEGYVLSQVEITDAGVLKQSGKKFHPIAIPQEGERVKGIVFNITKEELLLSDSYEVSDYKRIEVTLASGIKAWVYVCAKST